MTTNNPNVSYSGFVIDYPLTIQTAESKHEYSDSVTRWMLFSAPITDEQITEKWLGSNPYGDYCQHSYDCCGNWYADSLRVKRVNQRVLVRQSIYRNV